MVALRDPYTQATSGNIRFLFYRRIGGQVMLAEAIPQAEVLDLSHHRSVWRRCRRRCFNSTCRLYKRSRRCAIL
jgi:hypothetical protein